MKTDIDERRKQVGGNYWDRSEPHVWGDIKVRIGDFETKTTSVVCDNETESSILPEEP